jgi:integrase/recombinase XerD
MLKRKNNGGIRKICSCARRNWPKCPHDWHFNFKPRGGRGWRFSLDVELGRRLKDKDEAKKEAERIRTEIREGRFVRASDRLKAAAAAAVPQPAAMTLDKFAATYVERVSQIRERNKSWTNDRYMFVRIGDFTVQDGLRLGDRALTAITEDDLEAFVADLRAKGRAASTRNQYVQLLKASFRWATKKGHLTRNPISDDSALRRAKIAQRNRRLAPDVVDKDGKLKEAGEERRLLAAASPRLQNLIIAGLETCCRRGELLSLQWRDVDQARGELVIRGEKAKDGDTRVLPISTRLAAVLTMAKTDPAGKDYEGDDYVFGELGQKVDNVKRAWETCVLKAHGYEPVWQGTGLAPASRAALKAIDLHFHDLRHEGASRLLEAGWPIHHVQEMLGHSSLEQTSTYLNVTGVGLRESMRRSDEARFRCNLVAISPTIEHPLACNENEASDANATVN